MAVMREAYKLVRGVQWFYKEKGEGEPLVFLHGGFDSSENYSLLIDFLAKDFHVIALDRRGHGRSADNGTSFAIELMAEEVLEFLTLFEAKSFHIMGFSDGANICLKMGLIAPKRVHSLISISPNYTSLEYMDQEFTNIVEDLSLLSVMKYMPEVLEQYNLLNPAPDEKSYIEKTKEIWLKENPIILENLKQSSCPTLLVGGDNDLILPEQFLIMKRQIPEASVLIVPDSDHFFLQDFVWNKTSLMTLSLCKDFLQRHPISA